MMNTISSVSAVIWCFLFGVCFQEATAQGVGPKGAVITLSSAPGGGWNLPATVELKTTAPASSFFIGSNGKFETGGPIFSSSPAGQGATFYRCDTVTGFPSGGGRGINRTGGSSFIAIKQEPDGFCKVWICASAGAFLNGSYWEFQIRYYSGDPRNNIAPTMQIGTVPGSGNFTNPTTVTNFDVKLDEGELKLVAMEVTQVVQDLNNSVPLIAGKRTFVRAYLETRTPDTIAVSEVGLHAYRKTGTALFQDLGIWPSDNRSITAREGILNRRGEMDATLNFVLPDQWTQSGGELILMLEGGGLHCQQANVVFIEAGEPYIRIVAVDFIGSPSGGPNPLEISEMMRTVETMLPVKRIHWTQNAGKLALPIASTDPTEILKIINQVSTLNGLHGRLRHPREIFVAFSKEAIPNPNGTQTNGIAYLGGNSGWFSLGSTTTSVHEIAHILGRRHVNCGPPAPKDPDLSYPFPVNQISLDLSGPFTFFGINPNAALYGPATQLASSMLKVPGANGDLMGYCQPRWISSYTFKGILDGPSGINARFPHAAAKMVARQNPEETSTLHAVVSGSIDPSSGAGTLDPLIQVPGFLAAGLPAPGGYAIRFDDQAGTPLALYSFEPESPSDGSELDFTIALPWPAATQSVKLLHGGAMIARRDASAHAPVTTIISPNGGQIFANSNITITWSAADEDADPLTFSLQFSGDGGVTWETVSTGIKEHTWTILAGDIDATTRGLFRVIAGDGFHSTSDQSDTNFTIANNAPLLEILSPHDQQSASGLVKLALRASAIDREDGLIENIKWTSDKAGNLGMGTEVWLESSTLVLGNQLITATATDTSGTVASATIHLTGDLPRFDSWPALAGLESADRRPDADPDHDGLANGLEYVLGGEPLQPNEALQPSISSSAGNVFFTFTRADASETPDVAPSVEVSDDLKIWPVRFNIGADTQSSSPGVIVTENGILPDTISVLISSSPGPTKFVRLKVSIGP